MLTGRMAQLLAPMARARNPLGTKGLDSGGCVWGTVKISVSALRADQLHVKTEHTQNATFVCPGPSQAPTLNWKGGAQRIMGHSLCPTS